MATRKKVVKAKRKARTESRSRSGSGSRSGPGKGLAVGIGGIFLKAADSARTRAFYGVLGLPIGEAGYFTWSWSSAGPKRPGAKPGLTVFSLFKADSSYFGGPQPFMLNLRVEGLDALLVRLAAEGVTVLPERQEEPYGRFAWILDPDGNRIELWEPSSDPAPDAVPMR